MPKSLMYRGVEYQVQSKMRYLKSPWVPPELADEKEWKSRALRGAVSMTWDLAGSQVSVVSLAAGSSTARANLTTTERSWELVRQGV